MILKNLLGRKGRTLLTLAGIAIGVAAMVIMGALGAGLAAGYQAMASGSQADLVLAQPDIYDLTMSTVDERIVDQVRAMSETSEVEATILGNVAAVGGASYFFLFGHDPGGFSIEHYRIIRGEDLQAKGIHGRPLLLGKGAAESMEYDVGDTIRLTGGTFRVIGIFETGDAFEEGGAVIPLEDAQTLLKKQNLVSGIYIKLKDTSLSDRFRERIERQYPELLLSKASEFGDKQQMVDMFNAMGWVISALAIVVGGVGMTNTVLMSVLERTREIGVLRAVGWTRSRIMRLILGESLLLALLGGAVGALLGVGIVYSIRNVPLYGILQGKFSTGLFVQAFGTAAILGLIGGYFPARRASQLAPLEAMRYDGGGRVQNNGVLNMNFGGMTVKNLFRRKTRTLLTLVGIGIGVGAVVAMGGIVEGFMGEMEMMGSGNYAHLMAREAGVSDTGYSAITEKVGSRIKAHPDVANASGVIFWALTNVEDSAMFIFFGYNPHESAINHFKIVEGHGLETNKQIILGKAAAESMNKDIGDTIKLNDSAYRVVGIYESGTNWEEMGSVITLRDAQVITGKPRQVTMYFIELKDPDKIDSVKAWLDENFPDITVSTTSEFAENMPDMKTSRASIGALAVLMALVGSVGMTNTILMSVLERTRELGVLRAVGWSRSRILIMILKESLLLSGLSGLVGIGIGIGLVKALALIPAISGFIIADFQPELYGQALAVAFTLGALGGLYPAWRATKMRPIEALRYE